MILTEKYNVFAGNITTQILSRLSSNSEMFEKEIAIGDLFHLDKNQVTIKVGVFMMPDSAKTTFNFKVPFPNNPSILIQYMYVSKSKERLESVINHEVNHIISHLRSKGNSTIKYWEQTPRKMKNKDDKEVYFKTAEEVNSYYNMFCTLMKGKKFSSSKSIIEFLKSKLKGDEHMIDYYLNNNKEAKKNFLKGFYKDGFLEDNMAESVNRNIFSNLVREEMELNRYYITVKGKKNTDVEDELKDLNGNKPYFHGANETHTCNIYKTKEGMFVIEMSTDPESTITYRKVKEVDLSYFKERYGYAKITKKKELKEEKKMRFADVKEVLLSEDEITTVYKGPDCRIVKEKNGNEVKFSAIFADVPRDKIASNTHFPYMAGSLEGANIEKVTLLPNDILIVLYTNNKTFKYTKTAIEKKGNIPLNKAVNKLFTAKEKS